MAARRRRLAVRRKTCGFSQESLAEHLGVDRTSIGRWERGEADPLPHVRPRLAKLLEVTSTELDELLFSEVDDAPTPSSPVLVQMTRNPIEHEDYYAGDLDEMMRREFLQLLSITGALMSVQHAETAANNQLIVHPPAGDLAGLRSMNSHLWQVFSLSDSKSSMFPVVREQLRSITLALRETSGLSARRTLFSAAGDLFQLSGEIFFDSNRYTDAAQCYTLAAGASKEAEEYDLWACALTRHAFIGMCERDYDSSAHLLEAAQSIVRRGDSQLSTRHWVSAVQAEAFAGMGDFEACARALGEAEQVHSLKGEIHNGGWLRFDGSRLAEERGTCYVALGRPERAETALIEALNQRLSSRRRGSVLVDLAALGAQRRDIDQLLMYAQAAMALARKTHSGYVVRRIRGLRMNIAPLLPDIRVSALREEISNFSVVA
ncbi:helix-turn-helix transcriptional regulator [Streptomyces sp. SBT349]|uniref:helix-turn-helix transcriptional regulator n=1 Tax=Streptomyces sp. SBT349 TaxID=1580539 RepID=UPI00066A505F|nr:helix-turn-helix transcriptional regulator [Streptomyces sp. SBT349]